MHGPPTHTGHPRSPFHNPPRGSDLWRRAGPEVRPLRPDWPRHGGLQGTPGRAAVAHCGHSCHSQILKHRPSSRVLPRKRAASLTNRKSQRRSSPSSFCTSTSCGWRLTGRRRTGPCLRFLLSFTLTHSSSHRDSEYLVKEFGDADYSVVGGFNLERVIDDFIFMVRCHSATRPAQPFSDRSAPLVPHSASSSATTSCPTSLRSRFVKAPSMFVVG